MINKKYQRKGIKKRFFTGFFAFLFLAINVFGGIFGLTGTDKAYAEPAGEDAISSEVSDTDTSGGGASCKDSLGSLGWLVCPSTGKISEAVDFLYDKIEDVLVINPVEMKDGSPIYEVWKYFQSVTNILFSVFLLVVIFSQITGVGITNYGIKKALPKLIIAAVLVNLSFYICSLAVDVSNIFGSSLRGLFESIEASASVGMESGGMSGTQLSEMYSTLAGGTAMAIGGAVIAFETGAIWMLIPLALGALVSVVIGLITIAMRQAVVTLLIMIAPLAMVAYILPNTEQWFKKWKQLLFQMLIFYPAFSLLFGASSVAGWAIIVSSKSGFGILIGTAVQIFPLFFSWSLMKMSGTVLGTINSKLNGLASGALGGVRGWAGSHRDLTRARNLAAPHAYTPSMKLQQYLADRKVARDEETKDYLATARNRGLAYAAMRNYKRDGETPSKEGEESYEAQARNAEYERKILRHKNNMNKGMGQLEALKRNGTAAEKARLAELDDANVLAFDSLKMEKARGEAIDIRNAEGYHKRMDDAINAHMDMKHSMTVDERTGLNVVNSKYKRHFDLGSVSEGQARARYANLSKIMEGNVQDTHYAAATAAHAYETQNKIMATNMQSYLSLTAPTKDVVNRLDEMTSQKTAAQYIDSIIPGLRVLNQRGDTDLVKAQIDNILDKEIGGGIQLGSHASQSLASFLMFEVKDSDPFLRRFGKYINLETANAYNENIRQELKVTYDEYIKGYHMEPDGNMMYAKKDMIKLTEGTSLDNIERTAFSNLDDSLKKAYGFNFEKGHESDVWDVAGWLRKREQIQTAFEPAFLSASLKWLSGSEQINSGVKFWTGFAQKQDKNKDGSVAVDEYGDPKYILEPVWDKINAFNGLDKDGNQKNYAKEVEKYFRRKTNDYFNDQTTGQILGMRTDYRDATMEHLVNTYLEGLDPDKITDEEQAEYDKRMADYEAKRAEIQTRYGDEPVDVAQRKRDKDLKALKMEIAGKQVRKILGETGKLRQIYRTRTSGTAINAKDWLRRWTNLDNEAELRREVNYYDRKMREDFIKNQQKDNNSDPNDLHGKIYKESDIVEYDAKLSDLRDRLRDEAPIDFYQKTREKLAEWFGENELMVWKYDKYYKPSMDNADLYSYLKDLLSDIENYPGNY